MEDVTGIGFYFGQNPNVTPSVLESVVETKLYKQMQLC